MRKALHASLIFSLSPIFLFACSSDSSDPAPVSEIPQLKAIPLKSEVVPYEIFKVVVKEKPLKAATYAARFGELDVTLKRVNDTLLVGGVPAIAPGAAQLKGTIENRLLNIKLQVLPNQDIPEPRAYLEAFVNATDLSKYKITLDSLVKVGTMSAEQAKSELNAVKDSQAENIQLIAAANPEDQKIAAAFIAANRHHFDKVQASLNGLRLASTQSTNTDVRAKIGTIKLAIAEIGLMVAGPALIASSVAVFVPGQATLVNYWATAGAVLGARIFRSKILEQKNIIVATALSIFDDAMVAVSNSFSADFQQRIAATEQTFINKVAYKPNMTVKLRNLQPSDALSGEPVLRSFVGMYLGFRQLWQEYMADFGTLPGLLPLKEKEVAVDYTKVNVQITENTNVSGGLIKENDIYKVRFSTEELTDQKFKFTYTYTLPDVPAFKQEVYGTLTIPNFKVLKTNGDNQTAAPKEILPDSLIIKVLDEFNKPVEGYQVSWSVVTGGGSVTGNTVTNKQGFARAKWTLGTTEAENKVETIVKDRSGNAIKDGKVVFTAIAKNSFSLKYVLGNNQSARFGEILPNDLIVRLIDHKQLPVKDQKVWWSVIEGNGTVSAVSSITDTNGEAKIKWKLGASGNQKVIAFYKDKDNNDVPGSPITFSASAATYSIQYISGNNQKSLPGKKLALPFKVRIVDNANRGVPNATVHWNNINGSATFSNEQSLTDSEGYAITYFTPNDLGFKTIQAYGSVNGKLVDGGPITFYVEVKYEYKIQWIDVQSNILVGHRTGGKPYTILFTDGENNPIPNALLQVYRSSQTPPGNGDPQSNINFEPNREGKIRTDAEGKASININIEYIGGDYTFNVFNIQEDNSQPYTRAAEAQMSITAEYAFEIEPGHLSLTTMGNANYPNIPATCTDPIMEYSVKFKDNHDLLNPAKMKFFGIRYYKGGDEDGVLGGTTASYGDLYMTPPISNLISTWDPLYLSSVGGCPKIGYKMDKANSTFYIHDLIGEKYSNLYNYLYYKFFRLEFVNGETVYRSKTLGQSNFIKKYR